MYNQLEHFLNQSHVISENQFGFRKNTTQMALINLIDKITNGIDNNTFNISVFVDLSKAFDNIDHTILFQKLSCYGIKGHILSWFKSYLDNRTQYV